MILDMWLGGTLLGEHMNGSALWLVGFSRQGLSVALKPVLELALVDQAGLELTEIRLLLLGLKACDITQRNLLFLQGRVLISPSHTRPLETGMLRG